MTQRAYDPDFDEILPLLPTEIEWGEPEDMEQMRAEMAGFFPNVEPRADVTREDRLVPGPEGAPDVAVRIYRPTDVGDRPLPGVFEIHGGGFITGNLEMMNGWCDQVAAEFPAVVVSVDYRLAPENPFPAGVEDCYAALSWFAGEAEALGADPGRIAIAGQSAGGGLAAATALLARDRGGPALCFQLLEIPELDDRLDTPSMQQFTDTPMWNRPNAVVSWSWYLGDGGPAPGAADVSPYAAPARAEDLSGLPPVYISVMEFDPLRDEGIIYAMRLLEAGVSTELHAFPGTFHGSALVADAGVSQRSSKEVLRALRDAVR